MVRPFWFARTEIFRNKRFVLKSTPKFPNGISKRKMCLPFAIRNQFQAIRQFLCASPGMRQHGFCWEFCFPEHASCQLLSKNFESGFGHSKVRSELIDCIGGHHNLTKTSNGPFATNGHMVQNPPYWRASSLLFPHWDIKTKASQAWLIMVSLF